MATIKELSDGGPDGTRLGQSTTDLVGFWGATPADAMESQTLATAATIATVKTSIQALYAALKVIGLMKSS